MDNKSNPTCNHEWGPAYIPDGPEICVRCEINRKDVQSLTMPGDWVRFYRDGKMLIGVVQYIRESNGLGDLEALTDVGSVAVDRILEIRKPKP